MRRHIIYLTLTALLATFTGCGDDNYSDSATERANKGQTNNTSGNNGANNGQTNNGENNQTNNDVNNQANNGENNQTNNNQANNNQANNGVNNATNNQANNGENNHQTCEGAWLDENGMCRAPNDGVLPERCCEEPMRCNQYQQEQLCLDAGCAWNHCPPFTECSLGEWCADPRGPELSHAYIHKACAPNDALATEIVLVSEPEMCQREPSAEAARVSFLIWDEEVFEQPSAVISRERGNGFISYCTSQDTCEDVARGALMFDHFDREEGASGRWWIQLESRDTFQGTFDATSCTEGETTHCG